MVVSGVIQWSIQGQCVHVGCSVCPSSVKHAHLVQSCLGDLAAVLTVTRICALKTWVQPGFFLKQSSHVTGWVSGQLPIKVVLVMTMWVSRNNNHCVQVSASAHPRLHPAPCHWHHGPWGCSRSAHQLPSWCLARSSHGQGAEGNSSFSAWQGRSPGTESCQGLFQSSKFRVGWLLEAYQLPASAKDTFLSHRFVTMGEW